MVPDSNGKSYRAWTLSCLTKAAHISTPFITTFLLIHLSAPALANIGGSKLSSQTMIMGREYYQSQFGEKYLVLTPLAVHVVSAIAKRVLSPKDRPPRPLPNLLSIAGYSTALLFLPIHYMTHRIHPIVENTPILDYEFVKTNLNEQPWGNWFLYTGLIVATTLHLVDGMTIIWNTWFKDAILGAWKRSNRKRRLGMALTGIALPVLAGLYTLAREPLMGFPSIVS